MYGFVHEAVVGFVSSLENGEELLTQILQEAGCPDHLPNFHTFYDDEFSLNIVGAACKVLNKPVDEVLYNVGYFQPKNLFDQGFRDLVLTLGSDFCEMLENLDNFHVSFASTYSKMKAPSFKLKRVDEHKVIIHYRSPREGIASYAKGIMTGMAEDLYDTQLHFEKHLKRGENGLDHDIFHVRMTFCNPSHDTSRRTSSQSISSAASSMFSSRRSMDAGDPSAADNNGQYLSRTAIDHLFPWHISVNKDLRITSIGAGLALHFYKDRKARKIGGALQHKAGRKGRGHKKGTSAKEKVRIARAQRSIIGRHLLDIAALVSPRVESFDFNALGLLMGKPVSLAIKNGIYASMMAKVGAETKCAVSCNVFEDDASSGEEDNSDSTASNVKNSDAPADDTAGHLSVSAAIHPEKQSTSSASGRCPFSGAKLANAHENGSTDSTKKEALNGDADASARCPMTGRPRSSTVDSTSSNNVKPAEFARPAATTARRDSFNIHDPSKLSELLCLRGEFVTFGDPRSASVTFVGVPLLNKLSTLHAKGLDISDIPLHTNARDILSSLEAQNATQEQTQRLNKMTEQLNIAMKESERSKHKADKLLHSILPKTVAESLSSGKPVKAEKFIGVSILFSDIVGFTRISSLVSPNKVMRMLNTLFSKFDALCEKHNVYKVETVGDAYMVAAGAPERCHDHAKRIASFALDMVAASRTVISPMDGEPLQIRVGIHTGSITAGVVGTTRPRYCLFGDSVNTASRMESTSLPGMIQMSSATVDALHFDDLLDVYEVLEGRGTNTFYVNPLGSNFFGDNDDASSDDVSEAGSLDTPLFSCTDDDDDHQFITVRRNPIEVKGKGTMETHFLVGHGLQVEKYLLPPTDAALDRYGAKLKDIAAGKDVLSRKRTSSVSRSASPAPSSRTGRKRVQPVPGANAQRPASAVPPQQAPAVRNMSVHIKSLLGTTRVDHVPSSTSVQQLIDGTFLAPMTRSLLNNYSPGFGDTVDASAPASAYLYAADGTTTVFAGCQIGSLAGDGESTVTVAIEPYLPEEADQPLSAAALESATRGADRNLRNTDRVDKEQAEAKQDLGEQPLQQEQSSHTELNAPPAAPMRLNAPPSIASVEPKKASKPHPERGTGQAYASIL